MAFRNLDKTEWRSFCDRISRGLVGKSAEIDMLSLFLGGQTEAEWLPLLGFAYDSRSEVIEVALDGLDHLVNRPRELSVEVVAGRLLTIEIVDGDGARQVVRLRDPLMLPPASAAVA